MPSTTKQRMRRSEPAAYASFSDVPALLSLPHYGQSRHRSMPSTKQSLTRSAAVRPRSLTCTMAPSPSTSSPIACGAALLHHTWSQHTLPNIATSSAEKACAKVKPSNTLGALAQQLLELCNASVEYILRQMVRKILCPRTLPLCVLWATSANPSTSLLASGMLHCLLGSLSRITGLCQARTRARLPRVAPSRGPRMYRLRAP